MIRLNKKNAYLQPFSKDIEMLSKALSLSQDDVLQYVDFYFNCFADFLNDDRMPGFEVPFVGTFQPNKNIFKKNFSAKLRYLKSGETKKPRFIIEYYLKAFWPIRNRLIEKKAGQGFSWTQVPPNFTEIILKEEKQKVLDWFEQNDRYADYYRELKIPYELYDNKKYLWLKRWEKKGFQKKKQLNPNPRKIKKPKISLEDASLGRDNVAGEIHE